MSKVREHEYDDAMHDYMQWKDELERLLNEDEKDEEAIFEAKEMVEKYEEALFSKEEEFEELSEQSEEEHEEPSECNEEELENPSECNEEEEETLE